MYHKWKKEAVASRAAAKSRPGTSTLKSGTKPTRSGTTEIKPRKKSLQDSREGTPQNIRSGSQVSRERTPRNSRPSSRYEEEDNRAHHYSRSDSRLSRDNINRKEDNMAKTPEW